MTGQRLPASAPAGPRPPTPRAGRLQRARAAILEVVRARELTLSLVRRDLKVRHRGTFLGMLWSLTTPLMTVGLYYVVFTYILPIRPAADAPRPDNRDVPFAVYFFAALTIWNFVSNAVMNSSGSIVGSSYLLRKVYFPRAILPLSTVLSGLVTLAFEFSVLVVATLVVVGMPSAQMLWVPVIVLVAAVMAYGLALLLSTLTVFFRDVQHFIGILVQLWFWGTPILYSLQFVSGRPGFLTLLKLNPMTGVAVSFRNVTVLNRPPELRLLAYDLACGIVFLLAGAFVFRRWQRLFSEIP